MENISFDEVKETTNMIIFKVPYSWNIEQWNNFCEVVKEACPERLRGRCLILPNNIEVEQITVEVKKKIAKLGDFDESL